MGADSAARQYGRILRLYRPDLHVRISLLQHLADAGEGAAGADAAAIAVDRPANLVNDLQGRGLLVGQRVVGVFKLLGHEHLRVLRLHPQGAVQALLDALADIPGVVDQLDLGPVVAHQLAALLADGIGHDDDGPVALHRAHEGQTDALVAAGGLHDDAVLVNQPCPFGGLDHVQGRAGLDGASHVQGLHLYQDLSAARPGHAVQPHHGGVADGFEYVLTDQVERLQFNGIAVYYNTNARPPQAAGRARRKD